MRAHPLSIVLFPLLLSLGALSCKDKCTAASLDTSLNRYPPDALEALKAVAAEGQICASGGPPLVAVSGSVAICLLLGIPAAFSLARYRYRGREDIGFYILSTKMMAPAVVAIPIFFLFRALGLLDTVWALMLVYAAMNLSIVICPWWMFAQ